MNNFRQNFILISILLIGAFFRFYNLMHDAPYFFNPDERNMANAISQFRLPNNPSQILPCLSSQFLTQNSKITTPNCNLNPHFFAYGQFPLYLAYISDQITQSFWQIPLNGMRPESHRDPGQARMTSFPFAIFWLRFYSELSSTFTVLIVFLISRKLLTFNFALLTAILAAFSPGLIQSAHFGTTESVLTFFLILSIYLSFKLLTIPPKNSSKRLIFLICLVTGISLGSKLTGLFILVPPMTAILVKLITFTFDKKHGCIGRFFFGLKNTFIAAGLIIIGSLFFFIISSPYNLIDYPDFYSAVFGYEKDVAMGKYEAFYTRQFVDTTPIIFQAEKIFPYALGWPVFILGTVGFLFISISIISKLIQAIIQRIRYQVLRIRYKKEKNKKILNTYYLILTTSFVFYFLPNAFLFAKWTRFMTPIFPFFNIFAAFVLFRIYSALKVYRSKFQISNLLICLFAIISILPGLMFMSIYTHEDSRVTASKWIYGNIPDNSYILSETANVVDIPIQVQSSKFKVQSYNVVSFDFYHLDENPLLFTNLINHLEKSDYIFIPSRRIFANYMRLPARYPLITKYYQLLFSGRLGYEKIHEISSFPRLGFVPIKSGWNLNFDDEQSEETYTVFDHPVIRIYKKVKYFNKEKYRSLFSPANID